MSKVKIKRIGIIAEDKSDFETVKELIAKIPSRKQIVLKKALWRGCGRIHTKCRRMAVDLNHKGCESLIIIRDLDDHKEDDLKDSIEKTISQNPIEDTIIIISIRAIEAWLLTDLDAISKTFNYKEKTKIKLRSNTERIEKPKDYLKDIVQNRMKKIYLNTVHNQKIARVINLDNVKKCNSFIPLFDFIAAC